MSKKNNTQNHQVMVIENTKSILTLPFAKEVLELIKKEVKSNGDVFELNELNILTFVVLVSKKQEYASKEKVRQTGAKITARLNTLKAESILVSESIDPIS